MTPDRVPRADASDTSPERHRETWFEFHYVSGIGVVGNGVQAI